MARKFKEYLIKITNVDGSEEMVNTVDKTSYKQTMEDYIAIREEANESEDICTIEFIGITQSDEEQIQFTKEYNRKKKYSVSDNIDDLISDAKEIFEVAFNKTSYHNSMRSALEKKQDLLLHSIENLDYYVGDKESESIRITKEIKEIRQERRIHKEELAKLHEIQDKIKVINEILINITVPVRLYDGGYINEEIAEKKGIIKEFRYKTDIERVKISKDNKDKFDRITFDEKNKKVICFNYNYNGRNKSVLKNKYKSVTRLRLGIDKLPPSGEFIVESNTEDRINDLLQTLKGNIIKKIDNLSVYCKR